MIERPTAHGPRPSARKVDDVPERPASGCARRRQPSIARQPRRECVALHRIIHQADAQATSHATAAATCIVDKQAARTAASLMIDETTVDMHSPRCCCQVDGQRAATREPRQTRTAELQNDICRLKQTIHHPNPSIYTTCHGIPFSASGAVPPPCLPKPRQHCPPAHTTHTQPGPVVKRTEDHHARGHTHAHTHIRARGGTQREARSPRGSVTIPSPITITQGPEFPLGGARLWCVTGHMLWKGGGWLEGAGREQELWQERGRQREIESTAQTQRNASLLEAW